HVLVWHSQTPEWFFHEDYDKEKPYVTAEVMNLRLEWYIKSVLQHFTGEDSKYKDMFYGWDVLNEAISDGTGTYRSEKENASESLSNDTHGSNSSWWAVYQSEEYIINAFTYANKYAPESLELYYNDYNECNLVKRNGILALLQTVKDHEGAPGEGTRISGMGMQGHYNMDNPSASDIEYSIKEYSKVVGKVQITELDMRASDSYTGTEESKLEEYEAQRKRYNMIYYGIKSAVNTGEDVQFDGITFWGTVDHYSWLQSRSDVGGGNTTGLPCCPLLFDENYQPKPCFYVFADSK
ncbi:MAG: endo-1,4-beta-xylanase, partial [Lachnospiraceae bacterium]|nr:endo-1,4-beta-xylanase [Lachnospiraceae bacterium]